MAKQWRMSNGVGVWALILWRLSLDRMSIGAEMPALGSNRVGM
jgi:hypothetical protein